MGFCLFNNVAIAAASAIAEHGLERVLVLDWDVHHGNGTAEIFRRSADVLFASIHQTGIYPGTGLLTDTGSGPGEGYTINLPVHAGSEGGVWLSLLEWIIVPAALDFDRSWCSSPRASTPIVWIRSAAACSKPPTSRKWLATSATSPRPSEHRSARYSKAATIWPPFPGCVIATLAALSGVGEAESIAPDPIVTSRAAAQFGRYWRL